MKKIYNAPSLLVVNLRATNMIALSTNDNEQIDSSNYTEYQQNVKRSGSSYNVWDDDWNK